MRIRSSALALVWATPLKRLARRSRCRHPSDKPAAHRTTAATVPVLPTQAHRHTMLACHGSLPRSLLSGRSSGPRRSLWRRAHWRAKRLASNRVAAFVYQSARFICHQRAERSFHIVGVQQPVCARCTGLYVSGAAGALVAWLGGAPPPDQSAHRGRCSSGAAIPTAVTVALELLGLWHTSNLLRAVSALPLGASAGWIFVQSLRAEAAAGGTGSRDGCYDARGI